MLNKKDIECLLLNGFISDIDIQDYPSPVPINYDISFEDACCYYHDTIQKNVNELQEQYDRIGFTVSAGMDSSTVVSFANPRLNPVTVCLDNKRTDPILSKQLVFDLNLNNHHIIPIDNIDLEDELLQLNRILKFPATQLFLMVFHIVLKYMENQKINALFTGSGIDFPLMESTYNNIRSIATAIKLRQYDIDKAHKILTNSKYPHQCTLLSRSDLWKIALLDSSAKTYPVNFFYDMFNEEDMNLLGLNHNPYHLREQTLNDRITLEIYTYFPRLVNPVLTLINQFSFDLVNPFRFENIWEWVKTLPFEYRNCLGSGKHLQREAIGPRLPDYIMNKERTMFDPTTSWFESSHIQKQVDQLIDKYLVDKNNLIFDCIEYDKTQNALKVFRHSRNKKDKIWTMINLSMWLNIHGHN